MEIRFPTNAESPHYLAQIVFSRAGNAVLIEVVDQRNGFKCASDPIPLDDFREAMRTLGALKPVEVESGYRPLGPRRIDSGGF